VVHALALDELRTNFLAEPWNPPRGKAPGSNVKAAWFSGVHSNIGGGFYDDNLSNIAFFWVMKEACARGLPIDLRSAPFWDREVPTRDLRTSNTGFWEFMEILSHWIPKHNAGPGRMITDGERVHESVLVRIRDKSLRLPYIPQATYPAMPKFWEMVDDPLWQQQWLEPWGL
jgi:hypothetical protein